MLALADTPNACCAQLHPAAARVSGSLPSLVPWHCTHAPIPHATHLSSFFPCSTGRRMFLRRGHVGSFVFGLCGAVWGEGAWRTIGFAYIAAPVRCQLFSVPCRLLLAACLQHVNASSPQLVELTACQPMWISLVAFVLQSAVPLVWPCQCQPFIQAACVGTCVLFRYLKSVTCGLIRTFHLACVTLSSAGGRLARMQNHT